MPSLSLIDVCKAYGGKVVLKKLNLDVRDGELLVVLGPTGCGKTTMLNIISGLEKQDSGDIYVGNILINDLPPEERNMGYVFQSPTLFPHMNVYENVSFGLKAKKYPRKEVESLVKDTLMLLGLYEYKDRMPNTLSGGEQQKVALARALAIEPKILLLDEPFSSIDIKARESLRMEVREVQKRLRITTIHVTHDHSEALILADRIAVMEDGRIGQVGEPEEVFYKPSSEEVARFIGADNLFKGRIVAVDADGGIMNIEADGVNIAAPYHEGFNVGDEVLATIRPEDIFILLGKPAMSVRNLFKSKVKEVTPIGIPIRLTLSLEGSGEVYADVTRRSMLELNLKPGKEVHVAFKATSVHVIKRRSLDLPKS